VTRYNYVYDVSNHASDWYFLNEPQSINGQNSASVFIRVVCQCECVGPSDRSTIGWVACSGGVWGPNCPAKAPGFSVKKYGAQKATECPRGSPAGAMRMLEMGSG